MNNKFFATTLGVLLSLAAFATGASAADVRPTAGVRSAADVRAAIDRGEYTEAVKMATQALRQLGAGGQRADRYEMLMLKGQALAARARLRTPATPSRARCVRPTGATSLLRRGPSRCWHGR